MEIKWGTFSNSRNTNVKCQTYLFFVVVSSFFRCLHLELCCCSVRHFDLGSFRGIFHKFRDLNTRGARQSYIFTLVVTDRYRANLAPRHQFLLVQLGPSLLATFAVPVSVVLLQLPTTLELADAQRWELPLVYLQLGIP